LVKSEAAYLIASGGARFRPSLSSLVYQIAKTLSDEFGAFLLVEIWAAPDGGRANDPAEPDVLPRFNIHASASSAISRTVEALEKRLKRVKVLKQGVQVDVQRGGQLHPSGLKPLLKASELRELNCTVLGLEVPPVYRQPDSSEEFPLVVNALRRSVSLSLRQAFFEFARSQTTHRPPHYHALGRKAVVKAVWEVDRQLAEVGNQFDYLLLVTPVNTGAAWRQFQRERFQHAPQFHYRPLPIDPALTKRVLYKIPIERVEDPALQRLFREKQEELEGKLTMLRDRDTRRFRFESLQLFGGVGDETYQLAQELLGRLPVKSKTGKGRSLNATEFAEIARAEIAYYRERWPEFGAQSLVADDVSGLIVSGGRLLINADLALPESRVRALLAHEVGTHLLTYFNGRGQPFQQLYSGLAGYEELQEGLAVLAEHLVRGLSAARMRQLAARVVAVRSMIVGATFVDTFRMLSREYGFTQQLAYKITMRVYRGGGLTKDAIYLRGLQAILQYVRQGGDLEPLLIGKMSVEQIAMIKELQYRNVLRPAPLKPRYLQDPEALARLDKLRGSETPLIALVNGEPT
jgi:uncharacterized protein (TIGR02421 family)